MTMTSTEVITIIAAISALVTVIGGVMVNVVVAMRKESKVALEQVVNVAKETTDELRANTITTKRVEKMVDGHASSQAKEIQSLNDRIQFIMDTWAVERGVAASAAATLAATTAAAQRVVTTEPQSLPEVAHNGDNNGMDAVAVSDSDSDSLRQIEKNTEDTAKNTAHTEEVVQELKDKA